MLISEFISLLEETKKSHGDIEVTIFDSCDDGTLGPAYTALQENKEGKITSVTVVDKETMLSFL